jgi:formate-dependent nitrite reductase membrane component NrfD
LVLFWTGPIGVGIFLVCLGAMIFLLAKADEVSKHAKTFAKEKGIK